MVSPVSRAELRLIADCRPESESGYLCVYRRNTGYVAKCFKRPVATLRPTAREAAEDVVRWWQRNFGIDWHQFFIARREQGWALFKERYGWRVKVYIFGDSIPVGGGAVGRIYTTKNEAVVAMRLWVRRTLGMYAAKSHLFLRRRRRFPSIVHNASATIER